MLGLAVAVGCALRRRCASVPPHRRRAGSGCNGSAIGVVLAVDAALITVVLHLLVGWPTAVAAAAAGVTVAIPLA